MDDKVIEQKWEDGQLFDISEALNKAAGIVRTADEIKAENAKLKLLEGVNILLKNSIADQMKWEKGSVNSKTWL